MTAALRAVRSISVRGRKVEYRCNVASGMEGSFVE